MMIMKVMDFRKKDKLVPNGESSFHINQRMNNEAYELKELEDIEIFRIWNVINF